MLFNSAYFAVFFPIVVLLYFSSPQRARWSVLLAMSCFFYMVAIPIYILILAFTIAVDYTAGLLIQGASGVRRRLWLGMSIAVNVGVLFVFKYLDLFLDVTSPLAVSLGLPVPAALRLVLPIGLSFHTFQAISYTVEVYRGRQRAERHPGIFALYVMFFPQLVAGPIERPMNLIHQFYERHHFDPLLVGDGLRLMALGFFKKMVIADRLALTVNRVYADPGAYGGPALLLATCAFAYQILCDFSGYTDIARGAACVLGFRLSENFASPYSSRSVSEFWRRWHISLSTWFRDYFYIPLGGNRKGLARWQLNLLLTFIVSGLWHGANLTFAVWGALHGVFLLTSIWTTPLRDGFRAFSGLARAPRLHHALQVAFMWVLVTYAWIWFRAATVGDALLVTTNMVRGWDGLGADLARAPLFLGISKRDALTVLIAIAVLEFVQFYQRRGRAHPWVRRQPAWRRWTLYYATALVLVLFGVFNAVHFIYFQF